MASGRRRSAYHPGGAGLTVVDLDNADAIAWARDDPARHPNRAHHPG